MNRCSTLVITIITLLCVSLILPPSGAFSQQKTLKEQIVGAWTLVSIDTIAPDGTKQQSFGSNPKGVLILDPSGRYAYVAGRPDRPKFKATGSARSAARSEGTAEEFAAAAREFVANFGTWSVNEADKTLIRKYEIALIPNNDRNETRASVSLAGDELKLTIIPTAGGRNETLYRRAK
jgi:Lipocalin-like domain